ncbi:MAG: hypothetical protein FD127_177 [Acidimicrobiaceae bacterium]|nr:MAG: hypothetical protein FD127_177 [Acidimicrobiaceae bacterium]
MQIVERIIGLAHRAQRGTQALEPLDEQVLDHAVLATEARVDVHRAHAGLTRDPPNGERARTIAGENVAGGLEQRRPYRVHVSHARTIVAGRVCSGDVTPLTEHLHDPFSTGPWCQLDVLTVCGMADGVGEQPQPPEHIVAGRCRQGAGPRSEWCDHGRRSEVVRRRCDPMLDRRSRTRQRVGERRSP